MKNIIFLIILGLILSCSATKTIKFTEIADEITTTSSLKTFLKNNPNPKIVLRTTGTALEITDAEASQRNYLYNAIENELLKNKFVVRDRQLFNQIVNNNENNNNYGNLKEKSDTDLIIELINLDPTVRYDTNKYYDSKGKERTESSSWERYGATIEFKIIMIDNNEFAGIYKFNYTPCIKGCLLNERYTKPKLDEVEAYEGVEFDILEDFVISATRDLVNEMRN
ncbi:hypothetical protein N8719_03800 [Flavobacteriaceae bacterium]|nr:hypothetical protein [Flavobacteriaceae bacterium]